MTHVDVTIPDGLLAALRKAPHEVANEMRLACGSPSALSSRPATGIGRSLRKGVFGNRTVPRINFEPA